MLHIAEAFLHPFPGPPFVGDLLVREGRIAATGRPGDFPVPPGAERIDAAGLHLAPGFLDLQVNGGLGADFTREPEAIARVARALPRFGVTTFLPAIVSAPSGTIERALSTLRALRADPQAARPLGLHLEGPFLNPEKRGAHPARHLRAPSLAEAREWSPEKGVRMVTLAPELEGALELARELNARGVLVAAGHSLATSQQALAAFAAGVRYGTHLFNAMGPLAHREPGLAGALLAESEPVAGLVCDGVHVDPLVVRIAWKAKGPAGINVVSDAMAGLGMAPGRYRLGEQTVLVGPDDARLEDGRLAGATLPLDAALQNLVRFARCTLGEALETVTATPARLLGLWPELGSLEPEARADLVLLNAEGKVRATFLAGRRMPVA